MRRRSSSGCIKSENTLQICNQVFLFDYFGFFAATVCCVAFFPPAHPRHWRRNEMNRSAASWLHQQRCGCGWLWCGGAARILLREKILTARPAAAPAGGRLPTRLPTEMTHTAFAMAADDDARADELDALLAVYCGERELIVHERSADVCFGSLPRLCAVDE
jgi:hypothetical protein